MYIYKVLKPGNPVLRRCTIKKEMFNKITKYNEYINNSAGILIKYTLL